MDCKTVSGSVSICFVLFRSVCFVSLQQSMKERIENDLVVDPLYVELIHFVVIPWI